VSYREAALVCPNCTSRMEERAIDQAHVDVCPMCKGVWIEWHDGDIAKIAQSMPPASRAVVTLPPGLRPCPACQRVLTEEDVLGVHVMRCGECAGAFVTRQAIADLAERANRDEPAPPSGAKKGTFADRLAALVRELFGA
jgi:Zn-finger nucleic acid-binding protein